MYKIGEVKGLAKKVAKSFTELKIDPNMDVGDDYRYRAFGVGHIKDGKITISPHEEVFHQSKKLNEYKGGIDRQFPLIDIDIAQIVADDIIAKHAYPNVPKEDYQFGIHQIRIKTTNVMTGKPAPEGSHQDGFDYICVTCAGLTNIAGGNSILFDAKNKDKILLNEILEEEQTIIFDDKKYFHYASPVVPALPGIGYRDVFVVTLQKAV